MNINLLDDYLSGDFNEDYWSDEGIQYTQRFFHGFKEEDWDALSAMWKNRPQRWQVRLAEAVYNSESKSAIEILKQMLFADDLAVALAAVESLEAKDYSWKPDESLRAVLENLMSRAEGYQKQMLAKLIRDIE